MNHRRFVCVGVLLVLCGFIVAGCEFIDTTSQSPYAWRIGGIEGEGQVEVIVSGVVATLSAIPAEGWQFVRWEGPGDVSSENPHNIGVSRLKYYAVVFELAGPDQNGDVDTNGLPEDDSGTNGAS